MALKSLSALLDCLFICLFVCSKEEKQTEAETPSPLTHGWYTCLCFLRKHHCLLFSVTVQGQMAPSSLQPLTSPL